jgi:hypothetical protein
MAFTAKKNPPRGSILNIETKRVKFNKSIVIISESLDRKEMLAKPRNM